MKQLKEQIDNFVYASKEIDLNRFYAISITEYEMKIQGELNADNLKYCQQFTEMQEYQDSEFGDKVIGNYNGIRITLL